MSCGPEDSAGKPQGSEAFGHLVLGVPGIDALKVDFDVLPSERRDMFEQLVGNIAALLAQMSRSAAYSPHKFLVRSNEPGQNDYFRFVTSMRCCRAPMAISGSSYPLYAIRHL